MHTAPIPATKTMEDFEVGQTFSAGPIKVTQDDIIAFAKQYDPQDFHINPVAAKGTAMGTLIASGWQTVCLSIRMLVSEAVPDIAGGMLGRAIENLEWPHPVFPGDELFMTTEVLDIRPSKSKPDKGVMRSRVTTRNQNGDIVLNLETIIIVPSRRT